MSYYSNTKRNFAIVTIALILIGVLLCGIMTEGFRDWNPYCWFGHEYGEDGICAKCGAEKAAEEQPEEPDDGGLDVNPDVQARGMRISAVKIPRPQFAEEGIDALAESAQQLTATVTPADAENKEVDWSIAWVNASSTWANGKTVADYVTVVPTSDGALTANLTCLQAFAEQIVVTVTVRSDRGLYATAVVDYEKRILGFDVSIEHTWDENTQAAPISWNLTTANLNPTVDFVRAKSAAETTFLQVWKMAYDDSSNTDITLTPHYSIYTKDKSYDGYKISVAPTDEYITALEAAGFTVSMSAGSFVTIDTSANAVPHFSISDLLLDNFVSGSLTDFADYVAMRSSLRDNINSVMLQLKIEILAGDERDATTVYNIKFTPESVSSIVEDITLSPDHIEF